MQPVTAVASLAPATLPEGDFPAAAAAPNHFEAPAGSSSSSSSSSRKRCRNPKAEPLPEGDFATFSC